MWSGISFSSPVWTQKRANLNGTKKNFPIYKKSSFFSQWVLLIVCHLFLLVFTEKLGRVRRPGGGLKRCENFFTLLSSYIFTEFLNNIFDMSTVLLTLAIDNVKEFPNEKKKQLQWLRRRCLRQLSEFEIDENRERQ